MGEKERLLKSLDAAIDGMDLEEVDRCLTALSSQESAPIPAEDTKLFAARIVALGKEHSTMTGSKKSVKLAALVAAVLAMGATAYAANALGVFSFVSGDRFATVQTNSSMTEEEAKKLVEEGQSIPDEDRNAVYPVSQEYESIADAEAALDLQAILPRQLPENLTLSGISGISGSTSTLWLEYADEEDRIFGLTISRTILEEGASYTLHDMDEGSLGSYTAKNGQTYTLLSESNDDGTQTANIAMALVGEYEYAVVFVGYTEAQQQAVLESIDLTDYK